MQLSFFEEDLVEPIYLGDTIFCRKCQQDKPKASFNPSLINYLQSERVHGKNEYLHSTGTSSYCSGCRTEYRKGLRIAAAEAPPRPTSDYNCDCCNKIVPKGKLNLDHDHSDYSFRGWLCRQCNVSIGGLGDDLEGLEMARTYLRNHYER